jgi:nucleoid-associated protein EbfC
VLPKGLGSLGNLSGMLKQAMELKGRIEELKEGLANETVNAAAGGGMVKVVMNGRFELLSLSIDPEVVESDDREMIETLVRAAVNEGVRKTQDLVRAKMTELTGGMDIPGLV